MPLGRSRTLRRMRVKICGITNLDDAAEAVLLGAWAIGLIHYDKSPRACPADEAAAICAAFRRKCEVVGVFVNPELEEVAKAVEGAGLDDGAAERGRGAAVLRRGGAADRGQGDQGDPRGQRRRGARGGGVPDRFPPLRSARQRALGRDRRKLRLGAAARAPLRDPGDRRRRAAARQRRRSDRGHAPVRGRRGQRGGGRAGPQGPRGDGCLLRGRQGS